MFICTKVFQNLHPDKRTASHFLFIKSTSEARVHNSNFMKKFFLITLCGIFMSLGASAQNETTSVEPETSKNLASQSETKTGAGRYIYLGYNPMKIGEFKLKTGISAGWMLRTTFGKSHVGFSSGLNFNYAKCEESGATTSMFSMSLPLNVLYVFKLSDNIIFTPYAGVKGRGLFHAATKYGDDKLDWILSVDQGGYDARVCLFGGQIGADVLINNRILIGFEYETHFTKIIKDLDEKLTSWSVNLGLFW